MNKAVKLLCLALTAVLLLTVLYGCGSAKPSGGDPTQKPADTTPEATEEPTPEPTPDPTSESTPEPTPEPTAEPTPIPDNTKVITGMNSFFNELYTGTRNDYEGQVGFEFTPSEDIVVTALGRSVSESMTGSHTIRIWNTEDLSLVAAADVTPSSPYDELGHKFTMLDVPVTLKAGIAYRITSYETAGGDMWMDCADVPNHDDIAAISTPVYGIAGAYYPTELWGEADQAYVVPTFYISE